MIVSGADGKLWNPASLSMILRGKVFQLLLRKATSSLFTAAIIFVEHRDSLDKKALRLFLPYFTLEFSSQISLISSIVLLTTSFKVSTYVKGWYSFCFLAFLSCAKYDCGIWMKVPQRKKRSLLLTIYPVKEPLQLSRDLLNLISIQ